MTQPLRTVSITHNPNGPSSIAIEGLTPSERAAVEAWLIGTNYLAVTDGRIQTFDRFKPLPDPVDDPKLMPHWHRDPDSQQRLELVPLEPEPTRWFGALCVSHLCGYGYTEKGYEREAEKLKRWGFLCLRSRRSEEGRFYEIWYLPFREAASEELKDAIAAKKSDDWINVARDFLCRNASFGSLDYNRQIAAMSIDPE